MRYISRILAQFRENWRRIFVVLLRDLLSKSRITILLVTVHIEFCGHYSPYYCTPYQMLLLSKETDLKSWIYCIYMLSVQSYSHIDTLAVQTMAPPDSSTAAHSVSDGPFGNNKLPCLLALLQWGHETSILHRQMYQHLYQFRAKR
jgi:hypothetical protein